MEPRNQKHFTVILAKGLNLNFEDTTATQTHRIYSDSHCPGIQSRVLPAAALAEPRVRVGARGINYIRNFPAR